MNFISEDLKGWINMEEFKTLFEEAKDMSKEDLVNIALPKFVELLGKAKEIGFANLLKEMPDVIDWFRDLIMKFSVEEGLPLIKQLLPLIFEGMVDQAAKSEDIQDELEDIEDTIICFIIENTDFGITLIIEDGTLKFEVGIREGADVALRMSGETMQKFIAGDLDSTSAYMSGEIKGEGNISKIMTLRTLFEVINEELGVEIIRI